MFSIRRSSHNPILAPTHNHPWESVATFNGCPIKVGKKIALLYRAMSEPDRLKEPHIRYSTIGRAISDDGIHFTNREKLIIPSEDFDAFGCEDPRVTKIGDTYYIFYTALGGYPFSKDNIKIALATSKDLKKIDKKYLVTPFNAKAMTLFPEKINGKYAALLTVNTDIMPAEICYVEFNKIEDIWSEKFWSKWYKNFNSKALKLRRHDSDHVEVGSPPVKTKKGWLILYSHIQRYGRGDQIFGIEAVLLNSKNPMKIVGRSLGPFISPTNYYEKIGLVKNVTFPSGLLINKNELMIYYGATDTYCALATVPLDTFIEYLIDDPKNKFKRFEKNPIITPRESFDWEQKGTLNPAAIEINKKIYILYRAFSNKNVSTIGLAISKDGFNIDERLDKPIYVPRTNFEMNNGNLENCGCEDPRIIKIGSKLYMTYTAYDGQLPRVAITNIEVKDFIKRDWVKWAKPIIITPEGIDNKDSVIFPDKINGKYLVIHRAFSTVCGDFITDLDSIEDGIKACIEILVPRPGMWDGNKVGIATPPIKTKKGYLVFYHGVSWSSIYRVGAILLDLKDPTLILARTSVPILEPEAKYELEGYVPNVVFPTGSVLRGENILLYYGAADSVVGVASIKLKTVLRYLEILES